MNGCPVHSSASFDRVFKVTQDIIQQSVIWGSIAGRICGSYLKDSTVLQDKEKCIFGILLYHSHTLAYSEINSNWSYIL
jgi:hypothetical protein